MVHYEPATHLIVAGATGGVEAGHGDPSNPVEQHLRLARLGYSCKG